MLLELPERYAKCSRRARAPTAATPLGAAWSTHPIERYWRRFKKPLDWVSYAGGEGACALSAHAASVTLLPDDADVYSASITAACATPSSAGANNLPARTERAK